MQTIDFETRNYYTMMAMFANRMSTHIFTLPFVLVMTTIGDTQGVGPSTFSMILLLARFLISSSTFCLT